MVQLNGLGAVIEEALNTLLKDGKIVVSEFCKGKTISAAMDDEGAVQISAAKKEE